MQQLAGEKAVDYRQMIESKSPEVYENLKRSVETGRWPDGRPVTAAQRENALQAVIAWGERHLEPEQRVGYIDKGYKAGDSCDEPGPQTLNWKN